MYNPGTLCTTLVLRVQRIVSLIGVSSQMIFDLLLLRVKSRTLDLSVTFKSCKMFSRLPPMVTSSKCITPKADFSLARWQWMDRQRVVYQRGHLAVHSWWTWWCGLLSSQMTCSFHHSVSTNRVEYISKIELYYDVVIGQTLEKLSSSMDSSFNPPTLHITQLPRTE